MPIVSTHPHDDHITGLVEVMRQTPVGSLIDPGLPLTSPAYLELVRLALRKHVPRTIGREGQVLAVSTLTELRVLYAPLDLERIPEDMNDCSLMMMASVGGMRALMCGDASCEAQKMLLGAHPDLECDLLKVPHHGAREASYAELYAACRPAVAAISAGRDNKFGHPSPRCLELLASRGIRTARTDKDGDIELSIDSDRIGLVTGRR